VTNASRFQAMKDIIEAFASFFFYQIAFQWCDFTV